MNKITNKELLTLNDLTNLQWQHVLLTNNESTESLDNKNSITYNLKQLLTPESFIREDKEGNFIGYPYMKTVKQKDSFSDEEKEKGLTEMRKNAPVVMNYLEECDKGSKEGDFLKDWEVIYGADSYDIITGYIDNLKEQLLKVNPLADMSSFEYPTREEILSQKRMTQFIEFSFGVFSKVMNVVVWYGVNPNKFMNGDVPKSLMENVKTAIFKDTQKPLFRSLGDATGSLPLSIIAHGSTRNTKKLLDNLKLFKTFGGRGLKNYKENTGKTIELDGIEEGYITISERFDYSNYFVIGMIARAIGESEAET